MGFMDIVRGKAIDVLDKVQSSDGAMGLSKTAEQVAEVAKIWSVQELKEMMAGKGNGSIYTVKCTVGGEKHPRRYSEYCFIS